MKTIPSNINMYTKLSSSHFHIMFSLLNLKHFFGGPQKFTTKFAFSQELISSLDNSPLRYCKGINAIHVNYRESEKLRLNLKTLSFKTFKMITL